MRTLAVLAGAAVTASVQPAAALVLQYNSDYRDYNDGLPVFLIFVAVVVAIIAVIWFSSVPSAPPPREKTPEEYNAEAVLFAARRHHTEMQTELRKAEIEAARVDAVHKERNEIIAHDKKVRDLNARLDERRRAS